MDVCQKRDNRRSPICILPPPSFVRPFGIEYATIIPDWD
jgi:hypothetical protein